MCFWFRVYMFCTIEGKQRKKTTKEAQEIKIRRDEQYWNDGTEQNKDYSDPPCIGLLLHFLRGLDESALALFSRPLAGCSFTKRSSFCLLLWRLLLLMVLLLLLLFDY